MDPDVVDQLAQEIILVNEQEAADNANNPIESTRSRVQFNFNAQ